MAPLKEKIKMEIPIITFYNINAMTKATLLPK
jgi:hypothetical protein